MNDEQDLPADEAAEELFERKVIRTDKGQEPLRIDKFLMNRIEGATRNKIQQAVESGLVTVNGEQVKSNFKVKAGVEIIIYSTDHPDTTDVVPEPMNLNIVFEDDAVMIIDKPAGMVVHPGSGNYSGTLLNGVAYYLMQQNPNIDENILPRYGLVHRIDKNTSGLLLMAKTSVAAAHLAKQFFHHTIERKYIASCGEILSRMKERSLPTWAATNATENFLKPTPTASMAKMQLPTTVCLSGFTTLRW